MTKITVVGVQFDIALSSVRVLFRIVSRSTPGNIDGTYHRGRGNHHPLMIDMYEPEGKHGIVC